MKFFNIMAEQASLGSQMLSNDALVTSIEILDPADYHRTSHQIIYKTIQKMFKKGTAVDTITLIEELQNNELLEKIGGSVYLTHLINAVPNLENIEHYNNIIKTKSGQRKMYKIMDDVKSDKYSIIDGIQKMVDIPQNEAKEETFKDILINTLRRSTRGTEHKFEIEILNRYLGGVDKAEVITIGGYTSQGKSDFAIQLAIDFASIGKKILFLSGEMTNYEVGRRILANSEKKNIMDLRKGIFDNNEFKEMESISNIAGDTWEFNIKKVANMLDVQKNIRKYKPEIVFIDYLQNLGVDNDYREITNNMRCIQTTALKEEITIFVLSQLSREKKEIRRPRLNDLRGSGRIEELSNIVLLLYWEDRLKENVKERKGGEKPEQLEVSISKNRAGTVGRCVLNFWPEYCRIEGQSYENEPYNDN